MSQRSKVDADGELGQLAATFNRMASALQQRSDQLIESEHRYHILFDTLPLPMWLYDVESLRFLEVNRAALERYGYTRAESLMMTVLDIRPQDDVERRSKFMRFQVRALANAAQGRHRTRAGEAIDV